jgi:tetratricopeptide (TPR) repeat protein
VVEQPRRGRATPSGRAPTPPPTPARRDHESAPHVYDRPLDQAPYPRREDPRRDEYADEPNAPERRKRERDRPGFDLDDRRDPSDRHDVEDRPTPRDERDRHVSLAQALLEAGAHVSEVPVALAAGPDDAASLRTTGHAGPDWFAAHTGTDHDEADRADDIDHGNITGQTRESAHLDEHGDGARRPAEPIDDDADEDDIGESADAAAKDEIDPEAQNTARDELDRQADGADRDDVDEADGEDPDDADGEAAVASGPPAPPDAEQILAKHQWTYDPETLREVEPDEDFLREIRDMLTEKVNDNTDNASRARLLSLRAVVSRILGDLHKALADAKLALAHAEATGELRRIAICQARLANVLQWRGEYAEADRLFAEANSSELPDRLRGTMHSHAGRSAYDQGRYIEACKHFERALELGKEEDPELVSATELALDAVLRRVVANGWGPYPRTKEELLQITRPPSPAMDDETGLWGFTDADGETVVPARYTDIQPFREGVAWVHRPDSAAWELIDETGGTLIKARDGYLGVSSFAGGLAWVSRDGNGRWIAIDRTNNVTISTGFDDIRPFRRGVAAVRRNDRWGAVDGVGRVIVPFQYDLFATALSDGRYIDGFSDEGLAVVQIDGRKGVVDRSGRTLVEPDFLSVVIHPVAFLITDDDGRWGALDRRGRMLVDPTHPSRVSVTMEIDRLLADARPVL